KSFGNDVASSGAILNYQYIEGFTDHGFVQVTAIAPNQDESAPSARASFDLTPVNTQPQVEPLPLEGTPLGVIASEPKRPASPPAPLPTGEGSTRRRNPLLSGEGEPPPKGV